MKATYAWRANESPTNTTCRGLVALKPETMRAQRASTLSSRAYCQRKRPGEHVWAVKASALPSAAPVAPHFSVSRTHAKPRCRLMSPPRADARFTGRLCARTAALTPPGAEPHVCSCHAWWLDETAARAMASMLPPTLLTGECPRCDTSTAFGRAYTPPAAVMAAASEIRASASATRAAAAASASAWPTVWPDSSRPWIEWTLRSGRSAAISAVSTQSLSAHATPSGPVELISSPRQCA